MRIRKGGKGLGKGRGGQGGQSEGGKMRGGWGGDRHPDGKINFERGPPSFSRAPSFFQQPCTHLMMNTYQAPLLELIKQLLRIFRTKYSTVDFSSTELSFQNERSHENYILIMFCRAYTLPYFPN